MDMVRDFKTLTMPVSTKAVVVGLLFLSVVANVALFAWGMMRGQSDLLSATVDLFGVLLPVILLAIVLARADSGVAALKQRTEDFYLRTAPPILAGIVDVPGEFFSPGPKHRAPQAACDGRVHVNLKRGHCYADFLIVTPWKWENGAPCEWKTVPLHLEINVSRVNFAIMIPEALLASGTGTLKDAFQHTMQGAATSRPAREGEEVSTGYVFLDEPMRRDLFGVSHVVLVANKFVSAAFLWDSADQLYFAQDLMFMLRAFLTEKPEMFVSIHGPSAPGLADITLKLKSLSASQGAGP